LAVAFLVVIPEGDLLSQCCRSPAHQQPRNKFVARPEFKC
jgi:hypothetical protein